LHTIVGFVTYSDAVTVTVTTSVAWAREWSRLLLDVIQTVKVGGVGGMVTAQLELVLCVAEPELPAALVKPLTVQITLPVVSN
jgi:hypothetical protein